MPPKASKFVNSKAEAARERKDEVKKAKNAAAAKELEDSKWTDEGSTAAEKRRLEKAKKDAEEAKKRAEKKALQQKEEEAAAAISCKAKNITNAEKITRAQLLRQQEADDEARRLEAERLKMEALKLAPQLDLTPNMNRQISEDLRADVAKYGQGNVLQASDVDGALSQLSGGQLTSTTPSASSASSIDAHPERRMKSAYSEYEERMMPIVRDENPRLKLSQYKQLIFQRWQKAPENPFNIRKKMEAEQSLLGQTDEAKYGHFV